MDTTWEVHNDKPNSMPIPAVNRYSNWQPMHKRSISRGEVGISVFCCSSIPISPRSAEGSYGRVLVCISTISS